MTLHQRRMILLSMNSEEIITEHKRVCKHIDAFYIAASSDKMIEHILEAEYDKRPKIFGYPITFLSDLL